MNNLDDVIRRLQELKILHDLSGDAQVTICLKDDVPLVRAIEFSPSTGLVVIFPEFKK